MAKKASSKYKSRHSVNLSKHVEVGWATWIPLMRVGPQMDLCPVFSCKMPFVHELE